MSVNVFQSEIRYFYIKLSEKEINYNPYDSKA